jgi:hypothetical protein
MLELGIHVKALSLAGDGFSGKFAGDTCKCQSVTGKALKVINIVGQSAEIGSAIHGDIDKSAPRLFDFDFTCELWKRSQHACPHAGIQIHRRHRAVTHLPAVNQPTIRADPKVVENEVVVAYGRLIWDQASRQFRGEWI